MIAFELTWGLDSFCLGDCQSFCSLKWGWEGAQGYRAKGSDFHTQNVSCLAFFGINILQNPPITIFPYLHSPSSSASWCHLKNKNKTYLHPGVCFKFKQESNLLSFNFFPSIFYININRNQRKSSSKALPPYLSQPIFPVLAYVFT